MLVIKRHWISQFSIFKCMQFSANIRLNQVFNCLSVGWYISELLTVLCTLRFIHRYLIINEAFNMFLSIKASGGNEMWNVHRKLFLFISPSGLKWIRRKSFLCNKRRQQQHSYPNNCQIIYYRMSLFLWMCLNCLHKCLSVCRCGLRSYRTTVGISQTVSFYFDLVEYYESYWFKWDLLWSF